MAGMELLAKMIVSPFWLAIAVAAAIVLVWLNWKRLHDTLEMFRRK